MFNPVEFVHRLEAKGLSRGAAEAIATGIDQRNANLATTADLESLSNKADKADLLPLATKADVELQLAKALNRQTLQFGARIGGAVALVIAAFGVIVSPGH